MRNKLVTAILCLLFNSIMSCVGQKIGLLPQYIGDKKFDTIKILYIKWEVNTRDSVPHLIQLKGYIVRLKNNYMPLPGERNNTPFILDDRKKIEVGKILSYFPI